MTLEAIRAILHDRVRNAAGRSTSLRVRVFGRWGVAFGLGVILAAASASGHSGAILLPPAGDYLIRWYQPHGVRPVENWQIEVARHRSPSAPFFANVRLSPDPSCWALFVSNNEPATVRVRSVAVDQVSTWSRTTSVPNAGGDLIRFYQSGIRPVDDWDVEMKTARNPAAPVVATARVIPTGECWSLTVPVNESANVRIRSVFGNQVSAWGPRTSVPEVGLGVGTFSASGLLAALARRWRRRIESSRS